MVDSGVEVHLMWNFQITELVDIDYTADQNYPVLCSNKQRYSVTGKHPSKKKLYMCFRRSSPIIDGRIVNDITFATRLLNFLKGVEVADAASAEERDALLAVAGNLLGWQKATVEDKYEKEYLERTKREGH